MPQRRMQGDKECFEHPHMGLLGANMERRESRIDPSSQSRVEKLSRSQAAALSLITYL